MKRKLNGESRVLLDRKRSREKDAAERRRERKGAVLSAAAPLAERLARKPVKPKPATGWTLHIPGTGELRDVDDEDTLTLYCPEINACISFKWKDRRAVMGRMYGNIWLGIPEGIVPGADLDTDYVN